MKLKDFYSLVVEVGVAGDIRGGSAITAVLEEEKARFDKLTAEERETFDRDRLFNPFSDTRLLNGDPEDEVRTILAGIDMDVAEVLLAYVLNREAGRRIDLVLSATIPGLRPVQPLRRHAAPGQPPRSCGVTMGVAEKLMDQRIGEVERRFMPANHNRTIDAARLLGLPFMCIHTAADNCVTTHLTRLFEREKPARLRISSGSSRPSPNTRGPLRCRCRPRSSAARRTAVRHDIRRHDRRDGGLEGICWRSWRRAASARSSACTSAKSTWERQEGQSQRGHRRPHLERLSRAQPPPRRGREGREAGVHLHLRLRARPPRGLSGFHERRRHDHPGGRTGDPALPSDQDPEQAGGPDRRPVPPDRHPDQQLHALGPTARSSS